MKATYPDPFDQARSLFEEAGLKRIDGTIAHGGTSEQVKRAESLIANSPLFERFHHVGSSHLYRHKEASVAVNFGPTLSDPLYGNGEEARAWVFWDQCCHSERSTR